MSNLQQIMLEDWVKSWKEHIKEGDVCYKQKDYGKASIAFQKAIELSAEEKKEKYSISLTKIGLCYYSMKDYNKAEPYLQQSLELRKQLSGQENIDYAWSVSHLACLYRDKSQFSLAEKYFQESLGIFYRLVGKENLYPVYVSNSLALLYKMTKKYAKAENLLVHSLDILERLLGREHISYSNCLMNLASLYKESKKYQNAETALLKAIQIRKKLSGIKHPEYADALKALGLLYQEIKEYEKAYASISKALEIRKDLFGEQSFEYADSLYSLGLLYYQQKDYGKAENLLLQGAETLKFFASKDNALYLDILQITGSLYLDQKDYTKAAMYFSEGIEILRKTGNHEKPHYPAFLSNLAVVYKKQENHVKAESLLNIAISISDQNAGKNSPQYIIAKNNLALLYQEKEEYDKAEPLLLEIMEFCKIKEPKEDYASILNNIALLYQSQRDYSKAEAFFFQALGIFELVSGKENRRYLVALRNIANLYLVMAEYDRAETLFSEAMDLAEHALGQYHPDYLETLYSLAHLYQTMGVYSKPEHLLRQSIEIQEHIWGKEHPRYTSSLCHLAEFYQAMGEYGKAELLLRQAMEAREHTLGKNHPLYAEVLHKLAWLKIALKEYKEAIQFFLKAVPIENRMALRLSVAGEEKKLEKYLQGMEISFFTILSIFYQNYESLKNFLLEIYSLVLQRKRVSQELMAMRTIFQEENASDFQKKYIPWKEIAQNIIRLIFTENSSLSWEEYKKNYKSWEEEEIILEKELAQKSQLFALEQRLSQISPSMMALLLPSQSAMVEFVYFKEIHLKNRQYMESRYLAFLQKQDSPSQIEMMDLGEAGQIEKLIAQYKKQILQGHRDMQVLALNSYNSNQTKIRAKESFALNVSPLNTNFKEEGALEAIPVSEEEDFEITKMLLHATIFMPVLSYIGQIKRLIFATDGMLSLFPLEILEDTTGRFLIEDYDISYVQSGKDLLRFTYNRKPQSRPLIIANPDFDMQKTSLRQTQRKDLNRIPGKRDYQLEQCLAQGIDSMIYFYPLPESQNERSTISGIFSSNCDIWEQEKTLDFKIKKIKAPKILHLATHCFFMQDTEKTEVQPYLDFFIPKKKSQGKRFVNTLLRTGIAVSGINTFLKRKEMSDDLEDGLLTASDISNINLLGTDLVLLSLCETGSGKIKTSEAFCSLIVSFLLAGAKNVVTSLWKMPERERLDLLQRFYLKILSGKKKDIALRESQREIIQSLRSQNKRPSPSLWGAFVCFGEPN